MHDHNVFDDAALAGTAYALLGHSQDRQAAQIIAGLAHTAPARRDDDDDLDIDVDVTVHLDDEDRRGVPVVNALDFSTASVPDSWEDYIGQGPLKQQIMVYLKSAQVRGAALPHTLLASGLPGVGKTTMARLIAKIMGVKIIELVPPFNIYTLVDAAQQLNDHDILFIDEIHKLADSGKRGAEILLKVMEDKVAYMPDGEVIPLADITIIGATTDRDLLPEPVVDRFKIKPYFQPYSRGELGSIAVIFAFDHDAEDYVDDDMALAISDACRSTPRITEEMVLACRDLSLSLGRQCTAEEMLEFLEVQPDGMTRTHIHYLTALRQYFGRTVRETDEWEYIVGEAAMMQILRETKPGIGRIERFLIERGAIDRTPRGRRLTDKGIEMAEDYIARGLGAADV